MSAATATGLTTHRLLLVLAAVLAFAGAAAAVVRGGEDHLDEARAELADDQAFRGATTAGEALLRVSVSLQRAGEACEDDERDARCDGLFTAAAVARVSSVDLLRCRRPDIFSFRNEFRAHLDALDSGALPDPPSPPNCD